MFGKARWFGFLLAVGLLAAAPVQAAVVMPDTLARQAIVVDAQTGTVLFAKDADTRMPTSSMSKVLTMYLVFEAIRDGRLKREDQLPVSPTAWKQEGSRMFVNPGDTVRVEDLIRGVIIQSGNDASVVFAEALGGSESHFAEMMNAKAQALGMTNSHFKNATGLPDPEHYSTARDLATLALALMRDFPNEYHYYSETEFTYNNIKQGNRNPLLYRNIGADGVKTGHTDVGGYGLIGSSVREGRRLLIVVNGLGSMQERADEPAKLLDWGYREFGSYPIVRLGQALGEAKVWLGVQKTVPVTAAKDVILTLARGDRDGVTAVTSFDQPVAAPIAAGQVLGKVTVTAPGLAPIEVPLVAGTAVAELGFWARLGVKLGHLMGRD